MTSEVSDPLLPPKGAIASAELIGDVVAVTHRAKIPDNRGMPPV